MTRAGGVGKRPATVAVTGEAIRLDQFLKWAGAAATGGRAKALVQDGCVTVNGQTELRRGRRLRAGDVVCVRLSEEGSEGQELYEVVRGGVDDP